MSDSRLPSDPIGKLPDNTSGPGKPKAPPVVEDRRARIRRWSDSGGLTAFPASYDGPEDDWKSIDSSNPFEVLLLDQERVDSLAQEIVERHFALLRAFWTRVVDDSRMGAAGFTLRKKYGDDLERRLDLLVAAHGRLKTPALRGQEAAAWRSEIERPVREMLAVLTVDGQLNHAEIDHVLATGGRCGLSSEETAALVLRTVEAAGFTAGGIGPKPTGPALVRLTRSAPWSLPGVARGRRSSDVARPFPFKGVRYQTPAELAPALAADWDAARKEWDRGHISDWVKRDVRDFELSTFIQDVLEDKTIGVDGQLFRVITRFAPAMPPSYQGYALTVPSLLKVASQAAEGNERAGDVLAAILDARLLSGYSQIAGEAGLGEVESAWRRSIRAFEDANERCTKDGMPASLATLKRKEVVSGLYRLLHEPTLVQRLRDEAVAAVRVLEKHCPWVQAVGPIPDLAPAPLFFLHSTTASARRSVRHDLLRQGRDLQRRHVEARAQVTAAEHNRGVALTESIELGHDKYDLLWVSVPLGLVAGLVPACTVGTIAGSGLIAFIVWVGVAAAVVSSRWQAATKRDNLKEKAAAFDKRAQTARQVILAQTEVSARLAADLSVLESTFLELGGQSAEWPRLPDAAEAFDPVTPGSVAAPVHDLTETVPAMQTKPWIGLVVAVFALAAWWLFGGSGFQGSPSTTASSSQPSAGVRPTATPDPVQTRADPLPPAPTLVTVVIETEPDAVVIIDEVKSYAADEFGRVRTQLTAGTHGLVVRKQDYDELVATFDVPLAGEGPYRAALTASTGTLVVSSEPAERVAIDGRPPLTVGTTLAGVPDTSANPAAGQPPPPDLTLPRGAPVSPVEPVAPPAAMPRESANEFSRFGDALDRGDRSAAVERLVQAVVSDGPIALSMQHHGRSGLRHVVAPATLVLMPEQIALIKPSDPDASFAVRWTDVSRIEANAVDEKYRPEAIALRLQVRGTRSASVNLFTAASAADSESRIRCSDCALRIPALVDVAVKLRARAKGAAPAPVELKGTYSGVGKDSTGPGRMSLALTQVGSRVTGTVSGASLPDERQFRGRFSGRLESGGLKFDLSIAATDSTCEATVTGSMVNVTSAAMEGTYTGVVRCPGQPLRKIGNGRVVLVRTTAQGGR